MPAVPKNGTTSRDCSPAVLLTAPVIGLYFSGMGTQTSQRKAQLLEEAPPSPDCLKKGKYAGAAVLLSKREEDTLSAFLQFPFSFSRGFGFPEGSWTTQECSHTVATL